MLLLTNVIWCSKTYVYTFENIGLPPKRLGIFLCILCPHTSFIVTIINLFMSFELRVCNKA